MGLEGQGSLQLRGKNSHLPWNENKFVKISFALLFCCILLGNWKLCFLTAAERCVFSALCLMVSLKGVHGVVTVFEANSLAGIILCKPQAKSHWALHIIGQWK